jgi:hypothetical protein
MRAWLIPVTFAAISSVAAQQPTAVPSRHQVDAQKAVHEIADEVLAIRGSSRS